MTLSGNRRFPDRLCVCLDAEKSRQRRGDVTAGAQPDPPSGNE